MKKILLVDDMELFNFTFKKMISVLTPHHQVFDFTNPAEAYSKLEEIKPDMIFLDLNMPEMNGWDFLDRMQQENNSTPVFILTSSKHEADKQRSLKYNNVAQFISKPVNRQLIEELL